MSKTSFILPFNLFYYNIINFASKYSGLIWITKFFLTLLIMKMIIIDNFKIFLRNQSQFFNFV